MSESRSDQRTRVLEGHCEHCRVLVPIPSPERNHELEGFIDGWAKRKGYATRWPTNLVGPRTTVRLVPAALDEGRSDV